jgi:hypothetical protein
MNNNWYNPPIHRSRVGEPCYSNHELLGIPAIYTTEQELVPLNNNWYNPAIHCSRVGEPCYSYHELLGIPARHHLTIGTIEQQLV